jgi:hypothetical protein
MRGNKIFISYADADYTRGGDPLFHTLQEHGFEVYSFRHKTASSDRDFNREIQFALEQSHFVVVLWSDYAKKSDYVAREIAFARSLDKGLILVLLDNIKKPPALLARVDAICAFADTFGWATKVAEQIEVYKRHPRKPDIPYLPQHLPGWLTLLTTTIGVGVIGVMARETLKDSGFEVRRRIHRDTDK